MRNFILDYKIKKELKKFKTFKANYKFIPKKVTKTEDESIYCDDICIRQGKDGEWLGETDNFVNVGYKIHGPKPKLLSNLFPYKFYFKGFLVESLEGIFQSFKFKNKRLQKYVLKYSGLNSNNIKAASDYDWKKSKIIYFMNKPMERTSKDYVDFIDEMYISAIQNPLYRQALINVGDKYILHAMGETSKKITVFTREEFEFELNCLKNFVKENKK